MGKACFDVFVVFLFLYFGFSLLIVVPSAQKYSGSTDCAVFSLVCAVCELTDHLKRKEVG